MSITMFRIRFELLKRFSKRLRKEEIPIPIQKAMIKHYAIDLKITLTDKMTYELVAF